MSKRVARSGTRSPLHTSHYGDHMVVRPLETGDVDQVVAIVRQRLADDARRNPLLNASFSSTPFADALVGVRDQAWVAASDGRVTGHLVGALLESPAYGRGAWWGPDGVSFDSTDTLAALYAAAGEAWIDAGALEHYGWVFDDRVDVEPWYELGFARMHQRGVLALGPARVTPAPPGYRVRRGGPEDLELALALERELDRAQREGPSFAFVAEDGSERAELAETLADDEVHHYVVEHAGRGVAQCLTFALEERRGSHPRSLHLSALSVDAAHRGRGVATALVDHALGDAVAKGFAYAETNWRVTNRRAGRFWLAYGFRPTYVRVHRTIGAG